MLNGREFLVTTGVAVLSRGRQPARRRNVLLIIADDQSLLIEEL